MIDKVEVTFTIPAAAAVSNAVEVRNYAYGGVYCASGSRDGTHVVWEFAFSEDGPWFLAVNGGQECGAGQMAHMAMPVSCAIWARLRSCSDVAGTSETETAETVFRCVLTNQPGLA